MHNMAIHGLLTWSGLKFMIGLCWWGLDQRNRKIPHTLIFKELTCFSYSNQALLEKFKPKSLSISFRVSSKSITIAESCKLSLLLTLNSGLVSFSTVTSCWADEELEYFFFIHILSPSLLLSQRLQSRSS